LLDYSIYLKQVVPPETTCKITMHVKFKLSNTVINLNNPFNHPKSIRSGTDRVSRELISRSTDLGYYIVVEDDLGVFVIEDGLGERAKKNSFHTKFFLLLDDNKG
jgi:hypothetical protein